MGQGHAHRADVGDHSRQGEAQDRQQLAQDHLGPAGRGDEQGLRGAAHALADHHVHGRVERRQQQHEVQHARQGQGHHVGEHPAGRVDVLALQQPLGQLRWREAVPAGDEPEPAGLDLRQPLLDEVPRSLGPRAGGVVADLDLELVSPGHDGDLGVDVALVEGSDLHPGGLEDQRLQRHVRTVDLDAGELVLRLAGLHLGDLDQAPHQQGVEEHREAHDVGQGVGVPQDLLELLGPDDQGDGPGPPGWAGPHVRRPATSPMRALTSRISAPPRRSFSRSSASSIQ